MEIRAYAKINLTLEVLGRRPDGYHEIATILQTIDLSDGLHFEPAPRLELECSVPSLGDKDNLVWAAADALRRATGCDKGASIHLEKEIPIGMGLGGGSSDAAGTLNGLNALWGLDMVEVDLIDIAASLGSDVPFFLRGGIALGQGRGEVITDLPSPSKRWLVLACPEATFTDSSPTLRKTARLYSMLPQEAYSDGSRTRQLVDQLCGGRSTEVTLFNVFEQVAPLAFSSFEETRREFLEAGAREVHLSGAGPGLYTLVSDKEEGEAFLKSLKSIGLRAYCVSTVPTGMSVVGPKARTISK